MSGHNRLELLPISFIGRSEVKGVEFTQLKTSDKAYIYQRIEDEGIIYYEVFVRKQVNKFDFETNTQLEDMKEIYPKSNNFGSWAWCCKDINKAMIKFKELNE